MTDLLDLARMDADRFRLHISLVSAADPMRAAVDAMSSAANTKGIAIADDIADLPVVTTDPDRVQQAIGNLIDNAIRWTPAGGTITVSARPGTDGGVVAMVSDTGPGIEPDMREMVFEPFRSAETPDGKIGSGLGLAIARQLIRALGGDLTAGDAPGGGARFTIHLPPEAPGRNDEEPPPIADGGSPGTSQVPVA